MKLLSTLILSLSCLVCWGQNGSPRELGTGFAIATDPYQFENMSHYDRIYTDKELRMKFKNSKENRIWPFLYKPDYGLYHFIVLEKTQDYYKILINNTDIGYIPNDMNFYFKSWDAVLLDAAVERSSADNLILQDWKNSESIIKTDCNSDTLQVIDVIESKGEYWMHVSFSPDCDPYPKDDTQTKYGWIKWRTKEKLLVNIMPLG